MTVKRRCLDRIRPCLLIVPYQTDKTVYISSTLRYLRRHQQHTSDESTYFTRCRVPLALESGTTLFLFFAHEGIILDELGFFYLNKRLRPLFPFGKPLCYALGLMTKEPSIFSLLGDNQTKLQSCGCFVTEPISLEIELARSMSFSGTA